MSTRGAVGIRLNEVDKVGYNHFDSYPEGLGNEVLNWLFKKDINQLKEIYNKIEFTDDSENWAWDNDNHCLNLFFEDEHKFLNNSLFCEYAYIVNLDSNMLEYYIGFNKDFNAPGRYANYNNGKTEYCGVRLVKEIPLNDIFNGKYKVCEDSDLIGFVLK